MMRKLFASLLCYSLTLPLLLAADNASEKKPSPSQKKVTRRDLSAASRTKKTPAKESSPKTAKQEPRTEKTANDSEPKKENRTTSPKRLIVTNDTPPAATPPPPPSKKTPYPYYPSSKNQASTQTGTAPTTTPTVEEEAEASCPSDPSSFRFSLKHREANGIGYNDGYTSLDMFFMFSSVGYVRPFFDIRGHMTNDGHPAANVGFGLRFLPTYWNVVFGANGFFDFRQARHSTFEQLGAGLEVLGTYWNFHANGYFPVIKTNHLIGTHFAGFSQHNAFFHLQHEIAMRGFDINLGRTLFKRNYFDLSANLGGYHFTGDEGKKATGGLLRFSSNLSRFLSVEAQGSYDTLFKGIIQGAVALNIPVGKRVKTGRKNKLGCEREIALASRLAEPVDRFEMIVTSLQQKTVVALDPRTDQPLNIVFVNNMSSGGNGTAESPFSTLLAAEANSAPGDMIYVFAGNGTTTGMSSGVTLQDNQWLQGSGTSFDVLINSSHDHLTQATIPAQTSTMPIVSNAGLGALVTVELANGNIINGFQLKGAANVIEGVAINGATITNNILSNASNADISLSNFLGNLEIANNQSTSTATTGLGLTTANNFTANIHNNIFNNPSNGTNTNIVMSLEGSSQSNITIKENAIGNSVSGVIIVVRNNATSQAMIEDNSITSVSNTTTAAFSIDTRNNAVMTATLKNNAFNNGVTGLLTISSGASTANYTVLSNLVIDNSVLPSSGMIFATFDSSTTNLLPLGNVSAVAPNVGFFFDNSGGTLNVQSPNAALSGVQGANSGAIQTFGTINYVPITFEY